MRYFRSFAIILYCVLVVPAKAQQLVPMPWPVQYITLTLEGRPVRMAYMDVQPQRANGQTALLLHGKNFNGFYWRQTAIWLAGKGFRVVIPDQIGFGNSDFPEEVHYSFHGLAANTASLLDTLHVKNTIVIGHSMGGMLATRFALMYPERVTRLILEDPIGLEDYRKIVPYTSVEAQWAKEQKATYESYRDYQKSYYPVWKEQYDTLVQVQALALKAPNFEEIAHANALTYAMIYEQPVCYEFDRLAVPTLLIVGEADRTIVGKALLSAADQKLFGQYPALARKTIAQVRGGKLVILPRIGHIPHIQEPEVFKKTVSAFLGF